MPPFRQTRIWLNENSAQRATNEYVFSRPSTQEEDIDPSGRAAVVSQLGNGVVHRYFGAITNVGISLENSGDPCLHAIEFIEICARTPQRFDATATIARSALNPLLDGWLQELTALAVPVASAARKASNPLYPVTTRITVPI